MRLSSSSSSSSTRWTMGNGARRWRFLPPPPSPSPRRNYHERWTIAGIVVLLTAMSTIHDATSLWHINADFVGYTDLWNAMNVPHTTRSVVEYQNMSTTTIVHDNNFQGVYYAKVWPKWNHDLPCFPAENDWFREQVLRSPAATGFLLNKPMKVGGSTAAGVNLRMATSVASRKVQTLLRRYQHNNNGSNSSSSSSGSSRAALLNYWRNATKDAVAQQRSVMLAAPYQTNDSDADPDAYLVPQRHARIAARDPFIPMCRARFDHATGLRMKYRDRMRHQSFLWGIVRDPIARWVSEFFHFAVSRDKKDPYDRHFIDYVDSKHFRDNYLVTTMTARRYDPNASFAVLANAVVDAAHRERLGMQMVNDIMTDYDFIAVTERMTESLVVLQMLLDLPTSDILYLSDAKRQGGYDDLCTFVVPSFVSPGMQTYFAGPVMASRTRFDRLLHQAANRSLDLTIDALGRDMFHNQFKRYVWAQQLVHTHCRNTTVLRCSAAGVYSPHSNSCLWGDAGCGMDCIDDVVATYRLDRDDTT